MFQETGSVGPFPLSSRHSSCRIKTLYKYRLCLWPIFKQAVSLSMGFRKSALSHPPIALQAAFNSTMGIYKPYGYFAEQNPRTLCWAPCTLQLDSHGDL